MLRNTFRLAAAKIGQPQAIRKYTDRAMKRIITEKLTITETTTFNPLANVKCFSTNAPHLQKEP